MLTRSCMIVDTMSDAEKRVAINKYLTDKYPQWGLITQLAANIQQEDFQSKKARTSCVATLKDALLTAAAETGGLDFCALLGKVAPKVAAEIKMTAQQKQTCRYMFEVDYDLYCLVRDKVEVEEMDQEMDKDDDEDEGGRQPQCIGKKWARMQAKEKLERKVEAIHATWADIQLAADAPANAIDQKQTAQLVNELKQHDSAFWNFSTGFYELDGPILSRLMANLDQQGVAVAKKPRPAAKKEKKSVTFAKEGTEEATEEEQIDAETMTALKDLTLSAVTDMASDTDTIDRKKLENKVMEEMALPIPQAVIRRYSVFVRRLLKLMEANRSQLLKERLSDDTEASMDLDPKVVSEALLRAGTI